MEFLLEYHLVILGLITAVFFFIILLSLGDIFWGFIIWLLVATFLGKEFFVISYPGWPDIYLERIVFLLFFILFFVEVFRGRERLLPLTRVEFMMIFLLLVLMGSMVRTGFLTTRGDEYQPFHVFLTGFFFPFVFYYFGKTLLYTEKRIKILLWSFLCFFIYLVLTAYFEHFKVNSLIFPRFITNPLIGIHYGRARGPFVTAPVNGWVMGALFFSSLFLRSRVQGGAARLALLFILILTPLAVFYTYTRAVWLSFLLAPLPLLFFSKKLLLRPRFIFLPLVLLILFTIVNWENISSQEREQGGVMEVSEVQSRIALFKVTMAVFKEAPIFGVGFGRFRRAIPYYSSEVLQGTSVQLASQHNLFFGLLSEVGLVGLVPFLLILIFILQYSILLFRRLPGGGFISRDLVVTFWAMLVIYLVTASFIQTQFFIVANSSIFLWAGMMEGLYQRRIHSVPGLGENDS